MSCVTIFGKVWDEHVHEALKVSKQCGSKARKELALCVWEGFFSHPKLTVPFDTRPRGAGGALFSLKAEVSDHKGILDEQNLNMVSELWVVSKPRTFPYELSSYGLPLSV